MTPLARELAQEISERGPITLADYMARCNTHYYATRDPFGAKGDFTTAPEISQIFGELIGAWIADGWQRLGSPRALLVELGPGRGTLMKDALRATKNIPGFHEAIDIRMIETSPVLSAIQKRGLEASHPRIAWDDGMDHLPSLPLLLIANEFFDALPVEQYALTEEGWVRRCVAYEDGAFGFKPEGEEFLREESPVSATYMQKIASHIHRFGGAALVIDYGYALPPGSGNGTTLQALRAHAYASVLDLAGEADITAHVNFAQLSATAKEAGAQVHGPAEQGQFLRRLGAELRATALCAAATPVQRETILSGLKRLIAPHQMGELFKAMAITSTVEAPAGF